MLTASLARTAARRVGGTMVLRAPMVVPVASLATHSDKVKWFDAKKGFGFITKEDGNVVHLSFGSKTKGSA